MHEERSSAKSISDVWRISDAERKTVPRCVSHTTHIPRDQTHDLTSPTIVMVSPPLGARVSTVAEVDSAVLSRPAPRLERPPSSRRDPSVQFTLAREARTEGPGVFGAELLGTLRHAPFSATATYVQARELDGVVRRDAPLTPRHSAGIVGMWEREDVGRVGVEFYYTGVQRLDENPYADVSTPYVIVGSLAERQFGRFRLFVNGENLTGVRQTRWDPFIRPTRAPDGRWTVDAWAPLEGRNINGGIRLRL